MSSNEAKRNNKQSFPKVFQHPKLFLSLFQALFFQTDVTEPTEVRTVEA